MDFQELIRELIEKGWTQTQIAAEAGCCQGNIVRLTKTAGAEPRWSTGDALLKMNKYVNRNAYLRARK